MLSSSSFTVPRAADIVWIKDRFRTMDIGEVLSRLSALAIHLTICASLKKVKRRGPPVSNRVAYPLVHAGEFSGELHGIPENLILTANRWLKHRTDLFALRDVPLGDPIDWHRDYSTGIGTPKTYSGFLNVRGNSKIGDLKYIWELNRLQHLVLLALVWSGTRDENYGLEIERQVVSWINSNPFMIGINWKSPLEAAIRLISWAQVHFLTGGLSQPPPRYLELLPDTIYQHQYFIRKFYSKHSSANNHLIGEMVGLYVAAVVWPHFRYSNSWRSFARKKLIDEIARQVAPDGVGIEQATEYQLFILELFLLAGALGWATGDRFPDEYWRQIQRMLEFLSAISNRSGDLALFGDGDNGQVAALPEPRTERVCALLRLGGVRKAAVADSNLRSRLLLWGQSPESLPISPLAPATGQLQVFPHGGYYVLAADRGGEEEIVVVFDAGPLGFAPVYAHGHADALSFWMSYGGREFLIDPGTYCYSASSMWRSYFRGTSAHNTVRIDAQDQSVPAGVFLWKSPAQCEVEKYEESREFVEVKAFHDGYRRLQDPVIHRRSLRLCKKSRVLMVSDRLDCSGTHDAEVFFHFSEDCQVVQAGRHFFEISNGAKRLSLRVDSRLDPVLYRGSETPIAGWVSRTFAVKQPSFTLVARAVVSGSTDFVTEISPICHFNTKPIEPPFAFTV